VKAAAIVLATLFGLPSTPAFAGDVPGTLSFTARLVDDKSAEPVTGTHSVVFALFDADVAGTSVWTETKQITLEDDGLVFVELGESSTLDSHVFDGSDRYLEITVDGKPMQPRIALDSVPYAVRSTAAANADAVGGKTVDQLQTKITGTCNTGQHVQNIGADGAIQCASDSSATGDITSVVAGNGLAGGAAAGDATLSLMTCGMNQILKFNGAGWACAADDQGITGVIAGTGLMGGGTNGNVTISMTTGCAAGQLLKWSGAAWGCANDIDTDTNSGGTITGVAAGTGLAGGGTSGNVTLGLLTTCAAGQVLKWNGATWACANDTDTDTNSGGTITGVVAGNGLAGGGSTGSVTVSIGQGAGIVVAADTISLDTAFTDTRYLMLAGGTMTGPINMNGQRVTNRGCPAGYVKIGQAFCTENVDASGFTLATAAWRCTQAGAHLCTGAEFRSIQQSGVTLGVNTLLDWIDDQDADDSALYVNNAATPENLEAARATSTSSYSRCCVNIE
jgi:hypothetical protein